MERISTIVFLEKFFGTLLSPSLVLAIMGFSLAFFAFMSIVFLHHWRVYSVDKVRIKKAMRIYFIGSGALLVSILITGVVSL